MDFLDSILSLDLGEEVAQVLLKVRNQRLLQPCALGLTPPCLQLYQEHRGQIRSSLQQLPHKLPAYHNLEWRLDVQVWSTQPLGLRLCSAAANRPSALCLQLASRALRQQLVPMVTLHLSLKSGGGGVSGSVLQTEPSTLLHIISTLEAALESSKSSHARRLLRSV